MKLRPKLAQVKQQLAARKAAQRHLQTEKVAHQLYLNRLGSNKAGDEASDWARAQKIVKSPVRRSLYTARQTGLIVAFPVRWWLSGVSGKTSWQWLELLIVPLFLAMGAFYLENRVEQRQERIATERYKQEAEIADSQAKQEVLDSYLEKMQGLMLDRGLRDSLEDSEVRSVARAITTTAIKELDDGRNALLINFLQESTLIQRDFDSTEDADSENKSNSKRINLVANLDLSGVNLRSTNLSNADLRFTNLSNADLRFTNLSDADLLNAFLRSADLSGAFLRGADLSAAHLSDATLRFADLSDAHLIFADLSDADLTAANLSDTDLGVADLRGADLDGALMRGAVLVGTNLRGADIEGGQIIGSHLCKTKLPNGLKIDPNRDCP